jgi:hypothetical protein
MNVFAFTEYGRKYFCEFRNDHDRINQLLDASGENEKLEIAYRLIGGDKGWDPLLTDQERCDQWNSRMDILIGILEDSGCNIVWDN